MFSADLHRHLCDFHITVPTFVATTASDQISLSRQSKQSLSMVSSFDVLSKCATEDSFKTVTLVATV